MKITIESTGDIVEVHGDGVFAPARVWRGTTEGGVPVIALITRLSVPDGLPPESYLAFDRELKNEPDTRFVMALKMVI